MPYFCMQNNEVIKNTGVLLVDDDPGQRSEAKVYLEAEGYEVFEACSLKEALEVLKSQLVQALVLDLVLPDDNGLTAVPKLRRQTTCPIVVLTDWGQLSMRLQAIKNGADYFLTKPVAMTELSAVLTTVLRRTTSVPCLGWRMDTATQTLIGANGRSMHLTTSEWVFVQALRKNAGLLVSREVLIRELGKNPNDYDLRRMDSLVQRIRLRAKQAGLGGLPLRTRHAQGYVWHDSPAQTADSKVKCNTSEPVRSADAFHFTALPPASA
jgi:DNA-binding response OmpR family regulator